MSKDSDSTDKQLGDIMMYLTKTYGPPLAVDQIPGGYMRDGERRQKGVLGAIRTKEDIGQQRDLMQELLRNVGAKIQPIDVDIQESFADWEKRKAMETILREAQVTKEFKRTFVPRQ